MTVSLSPVGGAAAQFFSNDGVVLAGGKIYSYAAGTTTNQVTYTTSAGNIANSNPIILDSSGRVPSGEIWLTDNLTYKFVLKDANDVLIGTYDNIDGINDPTNIFATLAGSSGSSLVGFIQDGTNAVAETVQTKLREYISVKDFGAKGDGTTDDTGAIQNAINYVESIYFGALWFPIGTYKISATLRIKKTQNWYGNAGSIPSGDSVYTTNSGTPNNVTGGVVIWQSAINNDGLLVQPTVPSTYRITLGMENITWIGQITSAGVGPGGTTGSGIVIQSGDGAWATECHFYNVNICYFREYGLKLLDGYYGSTFNVMTLGGNGKSGITAGSSGIVQGEYSMTNIRAFGNGSLGSGETEQAGIYINSGGSGVTLQRISCTSNTRVGLFIDSTQHQLIDYQSESFPANNANCRNLIFNSCQPSVLRANFSPNSGFLGICVEMRSAVNGNLIGLNFYTAVAATGYQVYEDSSSGTNVIVGSSATGTVYKQIQPYTLFGFGADAYRYGTQTNNNAAAGLIGEFITATVAAGSAVSLVTATAKTVTSISLTAGDWDVSAVGDFTLTGATTSYFRTGVNTITNTIPSQAGGSGIGTDPMVRIPLVLTTTTSDYGQGLPPVRISLAATTTIYLVCEATFSAGTISAFGTIRARRMR